MFDKNKIEYFLFRSIGTLLTIWGIGSAKNTAKILAVFLFYVVPIRKKTVLGNLAKAFPQKSEKELKQLAYKNYYSFCITLIEIMCVPKLTRDKLHAIVKCTKLDFIKERYELNKGVIVCTAHFGNWELGALSVSSQLGIPFTVLAKPQRNKKVAGWLTKMREKFGSREVMLGASVRELYKGILEKGIVGIVGDQRGPKEGRRIKYFGIDTPVYHGISSIALKTGAPIITVMIVRNDNYTYDAVVEEVNVNNLPEDKEEQIYEVSQRYMDILEKHVSANPEQWFWMHKIWKY